jgi:hypothetical protein
MCRCISAYNLMPHFPCHSLYISFIYCTCWVPTISVLNIAIFSCYSNLLLRRRRWTRILWRGVLGYVLPQLPFLWCYGVFHGSVSLRVVLVFQDIIYVINILYIHDIWLSVDTFGCMCGTINPGSFIWWVLGFGIKLGMTIAQLLYRPPQISRVTSAPCWWEFSPLFPSPASFPPMLLTLVACLCN